jgi:hypothetical protein
MHNLESEEEEEEKKEHTHTSPHKIENEKKNEKKRKNLVRGDSVQFAIIFIVINIHARTHTYKKERKKHNPNKTKQNKQNEYTGTMTHTLITRTESLLTFTMSAEPSSSKKVGTVSSRTMKSLRCTPKKGIHGLLAC